jgi:hypothetical protein
MSRAARASFNVQDPLVDRLFAEQLPPADLNGFELWQTLDLSVDQLRKM